MLIPFFRIAEISIGEVVSFDDESHDLLCPRDHVRIAARVKDFETGAHGIY